MMSNEAIIEILKADTEGKQLQWRWLNRPGNEWTDEMEKEDWRFDACEYRIKPEPPPTPREIWVQKGNIHYCESKPCPHTDFVLFREVLT